MSGRGFADRWWSAVSGGYDVTMAAVGWQRLQERLMADVTSGRLLDVACGTGHVGRTVMPRGVDYTGVDLSPAMAGQARGRLPEGHGRVVIGRAEELPFATGAFDTVVSTGFLGLLSRQERALVLAEMRRVCRGQVRLLEPVARNDAPIAHLKGRAVAFVREAPLDLQELRDAGLRPTRIGSPTWLRLYSPVVCRPV